MTERFTLEPENYCQKDIVKYCHLSPSGNQALVTCKVLRLFVNIFTYADKIYSLLARDNLQQTIQMNISQKEQFFLKSFLTFSNLHQILNIFKKDDPRSLCLSQFMDS